MTSYCTVRTMPDQYQSQLMTSTDHVTIVLFLNPVPFENREFRFGPKVGQIYTNWDKSGIFHIQISVYFGSPSQNVLKSDLKKSRICSLSSQSEQVLVAI